LRCTKGTPAALAEESVTLFREIGDRRGTATSLRLLGEALLHEGDHDRAWRYAEESLALFRDLGDRWAIGYALRLLAAVALARKDYAAAHRWYTDSLAMHHEHGDRLGIVKCLEGLAQVMAATGQFARGALLCGAADRLRAEIGAPLTLVEVPANERCVAHLRAGLGETRYKAFLQEGRGLDMEQILAQIGDNLQAGV